VLKCSGRGQAAANFLAARTKNLSERFRIRAREAGDWRRSCGGKRQWRSALLPMCRTCGGRRAQSFIRVSTSRPRNALIRQPSGSSEIKFHGMLTIARVRSNGRANLWRLSISWPRHFFNQTTGREIRDQASVLIDEIGLPPILDLAQTQRQSLSACVAGVVGRWIFNLFLAVLLS